MYRHVPELEQPFTSYRHDPAIGTVGTASIQALLVRSRSVRNLDLALASAKRKMPGDIVSSACLLHREQAGNCLSHFRFFLYTPSTPPLYILGLLPPTCLPACWELFEGRGLRGGLG